MTRPSDAVMVNLKYFGRYISIALMLSIMAFAIFVGWRESSMSPTELDGGITQKLSDIPPFTEDGWIKVPFDRARTRECLTQSTFSLERESSYPPPLGHRQDDIILSLRNNPLSGIGLQSKLLWFRRPDMLPPGNWLVVVQAGRDCGSWIHPGTAESGPIALGVVKLSGF